jgi:translation initiation factor IF-3
LINERIRFPQVRVIDEHNGQLGVMGSREAFDLARERDLDLIVVAPQAQPPVCRIMDYGKFKYEKSKREKEAHKKGAQSELKAVRLKPVTSEHDRGVLVRHSEKFLRHGHKVRVICRFQGRQNAHPEIGRAQLQSVADALADISTVEGPVIKQGRDMIMNLSPKPGLKPLPKPVKEGDKHARKEQEDEAAFEALQAQLIDDDDAEALGAEIIADGAEVSAEEDSSLEEDVPVEEIAAAQDEENSSGSGDKAESAS